MKPIYVTSPSLPPLSEYVELLEKIWQSKQLTNYGPFHEELEKELAQKLGVEHIVLFSNGTLALIVALQALRITGEVITTPYSFVATTHALHWNGIKPVFCDIDPTSLNLDPARIEAAITPRTTAILPVHVYGNPCEVEAIQRIADTYGLKVIYDAAHAFGVEREGQSILNFGDLSVLSFHATKTYNTIEGGAIVCHDPKMKLRLRRLQNFGFADETTVVAPGINAKMNEFQAAMGIAQLRHVDGEIQKRSRVALRYRELLRGIDELTVFRMPENVRDNHSYFPILIDAKLFGRTRDQVYERLKANGIFSRRYFYPLISNFSTYRELDSAKPENLPVASRIAEQVLCLPLFAELEEETLLRIVGLLKAEAETPIG